MLRSRRLVALVLISMLAVLASACADATSAPAAAQVLGSDVTDAQLATTANVFKALFGLQHTACGQKSGPGDTDEAACNRFSLETLIQFRLAEAYAGDHGVTVAETDLTTSIARFESRVGKEALDGQLQANGVTRDDFTELVRSFLLESAVAKQLALEGADEAKLRAAYEQNLAAYTTLTVDHILVKTKAEAEQVYRQVTAPGATRQDFLALAEQVSIDPSAKQNSGALPASPASQYVAEFADAAVALEPGQISRPVQTQFGWHVIHLVDKRITPFEQVRDQLVSPQDQTAAFNAWAQEQARAGQVDVNPSFGTYEPDTLKVVRITSTDPSATSTSSGTDVPTAPSSPSG
jgi:PPIC-type PPIASE domain/SurA-like N-terminal domain